MALSRPWSWDLLGNHQPIHDIAGLESDRVHEHSVLADYGYTWEFGVFLSESLGYRISILPSLRLGLSMADEQRRKNLRREG